MCFTEFIGYTCGHTSPEVLRPCPMTTNSHTNPICSSHGRRPILAEEMCPACQRILHGRAVLILEWEHHWMHERGVCGCPVVFPDLIRPRVVGRGRPFEATEQVQHDTNKENKTSRVGKGKSKNDGKGKTTTNLTDHASTLPKTRSATHTEARLSSLPKRPTTDNGVAFKKTSAKKNPGMKGESKPAGFEVRIASFYGVEWVDEHRQLHKAGSCQCPGDFSFYQTPEAYRNASSSSRYGHEQAVHAANFYSAAGRTFEGTSSPDHSKGQAFSLSSGFTPRSSHTYNNFTTPGPQDYMKPSYLGGLQNPVAWGQGYPSQQSQAQQYQDWYQGTQPGNPYQAYHPWTQAAQQQPGSIYQGDQPLQPASFLSNVGLPMRSPGAIYQVDPARSTNPLYNYACKEGGKVGPYVDGQTVDYHKAKDAPLPLVGLPIGAGPEGPDLLSHVGRFDRCVLHDRGAPAGPGKPSAGAGSGVRKGGGGAPAQAGAKPVSTGNDSSGGGGGDNEIRAARPPCRKSASVACLNELKVGRRNSASGGPGWRSLGAGSVVGSEDGTR